MDFNEVHRALKLHFFLNLNQRCAPAVKILHSPSCRPIPTETCFYDYRKWLMTTEYCFMTTENRFYDLGPNLLTDVTWTQICLSICSDNSHDWKFQSRSLRAARRFRIHIDHMVVVVLRENRLPVYPLK